MVKGLMGINTRKTLPSPPTSDMTVFSLCDFKSKQEILRRIKYVLVFSKREHPSQTFVCPVSTHTHSLTFYPHILLHINLRYIIILRIGWSLSKDTLRDVNWLLIRWSRPWSHLLCPRLTCRSWALPSWREQTEGSFISSSTLRGRRTKFTQTCWVSELVSEAVEGVGGGGRHFSWPGDLRSWRCGRSQTIDAPPDAPLIYRPHNWQIKACLCIPLTSWTNVQLSTWAISVDMYFHSTHRHIELNLIVSIYCRTLCTTVRATTHFLFTRCAKWWTSFFFFFKLTDSRNNLKALSQKKRKKEEKKKKNQSEQC